MAAELLEGKAREEQPDRLAASTCVIAEPGVLYSAGAKTLSLPFNPPSPALIIGAWLSASCFSEGHLFVLHVIHTSLSFLLHFCHHTSSLSLCVILHLPQITHQLPCKIYKPCHHDAHRWQLPVVLPSDWWRDFQTENSW